MVYYKEQKEAFSHKCKELRDNFVTHAESKAIIMLTNGMFNVSLDLFVVEGF